MRKITIVLEITDPETVDEYWEVAPELIHDDLVRGTLVQKCELVDVSNGRRDHDK